MSTIASTVAGTIALTPSDEVAAGLPVRTDLWIDGGFRPAVSGKRFDRVSPRDGRLVAAVAEGDVADVDLAVAAARRAFEDGRWRDLHPRERRATLLRLADLVERDADELARLESLDVGKPVSHARAVDIRVTLQTLRFYAEAADKGYDTVAPTGPAVHATITREPLGVVGAVVPWNFPLMMAVWKIAPALAVGNSMVVKPAEQSPLTLLRFAELAAEAGLPDGVLNVVPGFGPTAGAALGRHLDVDALTFTGSGQVGRMFLTYAAESNIKEVSLELGGKSPQLVLADAPDTAAVAKAVAVGSSSTPARCARRARGSSSTAPARTSSSRPWSRAQRLRLGDPLDPKTFVGALVEAEHLERVLGHIGAAHEDGARLLTGGSQVLAETGGCTSSRRSSTTSRPGRGWPSRRSSGRCSPSSLRRARRGHRAGERHRLRARRLGLDQGPVVRAPRLAPPARRHGLGELLRRERRHGAVRRLRAVRLRRPRQGPGRDGQVHAHEDDVDGAVTATDPSGTATGTAVVRRDEVTPADPGPRTGPRVDVLVSLNFPDLTEHVAQIVRRFTRVALEGCAQLGLDWRLVDTSADLPPVAQVLAADGLLLLGGGDVDSELYGVPGPARNEFGVDPAADLFCMEAIRGAVEPGSRCSRCAGARSCSTSRSAARSCPTSTPPTCTAATTRRGCSSTSG